MKNKKATIQRVELMKAQLRDLRRSALEASRKGSTEDAAKLSAEAMRLNRQILEAEGLASFA
jgi:hypothetical protein